MFLYLDAALERIGAEAERTFHDQVEAVRLGTITAHDKAALSRWRSLQARLSHMAAPASAEGGRGLTGAALERALHAMSITNPDIVAVQVVPAGG